MAESKSIVTEVTGDLFELAPDDAVLVREFLPFFSSLLDIPM
jgi:hypothetical protein